MSLPPLGILNQRARPGLCRWIEGNVLFKDWRCCSRPVLAGSVYCPGHDAKVQYGHRRRLGQLEAELAI